MHLLCPAREDLLIGGCWNEAVSSPECGRYAVQLDSDDMYSGPDTLQKIYNVFKKEKCAMVIGSYTLVNSNLEVIPPGLIDHKEWTPENGQEQCNARKWIGAPRAFDTAILRTDLAAEYKLWRGLCCRIAYLSGNIELDVFIHPFIIAGDGKIIQMQRCRWIRSTEMIFIKTRYVR